MKNAKTALSLYTSMVKRAIELELTPQDLVAQTGMPYVSAWRILNEKAKRPTLLTFAQLADALGMRIEVNS